MDGLAKAIVGVHGLIWVGIAVLLIALLVRRLRIRKEETFEKRDN